MGRGEPMVQLPTEYRWRRIPCWLEAPQGRGSAMMGRRAYLLLAATLVVEAALMVGVASAREETPAQAGGTPTGDSRGEVTTQAKKKKLRAFWHMQDRARLVDSSRYRNNGSTHHISSVKGLRKKGYHTESV
jgi:hypothetical protein